MGNKNINQKIEITWIIIIQYKIFKNNFRRIKTQNIIIFLVWNYTIMYELSTEKCLYTTEMKIIEYNRKKQMNIERGINKYFIF
jgi:hypothetical protein